jgi:NAD-dependent DNA ligase
MSDLDDHGQPKTLEFNWKRRIERDTENLLGLARGLTADGQLDEAETACLVDWLNKHAHASRTWPAKVVYERVARALEDGVIDAEERQELFELLRQMVGPDYPGAMASTELPFADPSVQVFHSGFSFCATGKFAYGPRNLVEKEIEKRGGFVHGMVTLGTDYLIIGSVGSRDWKHSCYGNKIEKAATYREKGSRIAIVGEDRWVAALEGDTA